MASPAITSRWPPGGQKTSPEDVAEILSWLSGGDLPESVASFRFDPRALRDVTPRQRAIYRGVICLILCGGARDFHTQAVITGKLMTEEGVDDHHVFPAAYLERRDVVPARRRDCVLNRTLIDRTTNQMISARAPSDYLAEIRDTPGFPFVQVLVSHGLPAGVESPWYATTTRGSWHFARSACGRRSSASRAQQRRRISRPTTRTWNEDRKKLTL